MTRLANPTVQSKDSPPEPPHINQKQQMPAEPVSPTDQEEHAPTQQVKPPSPSPSPGPAPPAAHTAAPPLHSEASAEWKRQKENEGAQNDAIDAIMEMSGLEKVKDQILRIKAKVEVAARQGTSLKNERFSVSMLGNPGTGK